MRSHSRGVRMDRRPPRTVFINRLVDEEQCRLSEGVGHPVRSLKNYGNCGGTLSAPTVRNVAIAGGHRPPLQFIVASRYFVEVGSTLPLRGGELLLQFGQDASSSFDP